MIVTAARHTATSMIALEKSTQCDRLPWQEKLYCRALPCLSSVL